MKKFITLSMALTMALCSLSYGAVINPKQDGNIIQKLMTQIYNVMLLQHI